MKRIGYLSLTTAAVFGAAAIGVTTAFAASGTPDYPTVKVALDVAPYRHTRIDHPLTLTAVLNYTNSSSVPTGTVSFSTGAEDLGASCANAPVVVKHNVPEATCTIPKAKLFMEWFSATYNGDANYDPDSTDDDRYQVTAPTVTTVTMPARSRVGQTVVVTAHTMRPEGRYPVGGKLVLYRNGRVVSSAMLGYVHIGDFRTKVTFHHAGTYYFSAQYFGEQEYLASAGHATIKVRKAS
jgi:hypothetical protein